MDHHWFGSVFCSVVSSASVVLIIWVVVLVLGPGVAVVVLLVVVGFVVVAVVVEVVVVVLGHGKQPWVRARLARRRMKAKVSFMFRTVTNCVSVSPILVFMRILCYLLRDF